MLRYKLLLVGLSFLLLIVGCAREYKCDAGTFDAVTGEFHSLGAPGDGSVGTSFIATMTVTWPDGVKDAEENCEESYNQDEEMPHFTCRCEKAD